MIDKSFTRINNLELHCEFEDEELYNVLRNFQFLMLHTYKMGIKQIKFTEGKFGKCDYTYGIQTFFANEQEKIHFHLAGFVGRDKDTKKIKFVVKDWGRMKWVESEGFEPTEENYNRVGVLAICKKFEDFILFMALKKGYEFSGYLKEIKN